MADKCSPQQYLDVTIDSFQNYMESAVEGGWSPEQAIKSMIVELVKEDSQVPSKAFFTFLKDSAEYELFAPSIAEYIETGKQNFFLEEIIKTPITQDYLDPDEPNPILDNQLIIEGLDTEEGKAEDGSTKTMNYDNPSMIDTIFLKGINIRLTPTQYAAIAEEAREIDFDSAIKYIIKTLKQKDLIDTPKKEKLWRRWHNSNLAINRKQNTSNLYLSDLYQRKNGSFYKKKNKFKLQKKAVQNNSFINPKTGRREPSTEFVPFYDHNRPYGKNKTATLKDSTLTITIKDGILNANIKKNGEIFYRNANNRITPSYLKSIDVQFMSMPLGLKQTLVAAVPGDSGKLVFATILGEHYSMLLPSSRFKEFDTEFKENLSVLLF